MKFLSPKKPVIDASIGLDIGSSYIKAVCLRRESANIFLDNFCIYNISKSIPELLKEIASKCKLPTNKVNISLSGKSTIVRDLWMPQMKQEELRVSLGFELDQYIPFPVEDVYYDSYILEENKLTRKNGQMRVVLAVANKKFVNERLQWLKEAGFIPGVICMDAVSLFNVFSWNIQSEGITALVDIGVNKAIIDIITDNTLTFTREVEYGLMSIRENISRGLSISQDEAEKLICKGDPKIESWVQDLGDKLGKELWSSFEYYEGQEQRPIEKVYVTGGGSILVGLVNLLSQAVGLPINVWNPMDKLKLNLDGAKKQEFIKSAPVFSIAVGLAYRTL